MDYTWREVRPHINPSVVRVEKGDQATIYAVQGSAISCCEVLISSHPKRGLGSSSRKRSIFVSFPVHVWLSEEEGSFTSSSHCLFNLHDVRLFTHLCSQGFPIRKTPRLLTALG